MNERRDIERAVVAACADDPKAARQLCRFLRPEHFRDPLSRHFIIVASKLVESNQDVTLSGVECLGKFSSSESIELFEIQARSPVIAPGILARKLTEEYIRDLALALRSSITKDSDAFDLLHSALDFTAAAASAIAPLQRKPKLETLAEYQGYLLENAEKGIRRTPTGFATLDRMLLGGLTSGDLTLLGGLPGSGKTSFALQLAINAARSGSKVVFVEGEMPSHEIYERANGILTGENIDDIRSGRRFDQLSREAIAQLYAMPLSIVEHTNRDPVAALSEIQAAAGEGAKLVILDYLQVFSGRGKEASEDYHRVKVFSESLRQVALKHKIHLLVLSSLNRNEQRDSVSLNSFYGSSGLGHDASTAMILSGKERDASEIISGERSVKLKVVKNRSGARGELNLRYLLRSQRMEEVSDRTPPHPRVPVAGGEDQNISELTTKEGMTL